MPKSRQRGKTKRNGTERKGNWVAMERKDAGLLGASETNDKHAKLLVQHTEKKGKIGIKVKRLDLIFYRLKKIIIILLSFCFYN